MHHVVGCVTRMVGGLIMAHGDDNGLRVPPRLAAVQVVVIAVRDEGDVVARCRALVDELRAAGVRAELDDKTGGSLGRRVTDWELKGVPVRLEIGPATSPTTRPRWRTASAVARKRVWALTDVVDTVLAVLEEEQSALLAEAIDLRESRTADVTTLDDAREGAATGWARIAWDRIGAEGEAELAQTGVTVRCLVRADGSLPDGDHEPDLVAYVARVLKGCCADGARSADRGGGCTGTSRWRGPGDALFSRRGARLLWWTGGRCLLRSLSTCSRHPGATLRRCSPRAIAAWSPTSSRCGGRFWSRPVRHVGVVGDVCASRARWGSTWASTASTLGRRPLSRAGRWLSSRAALIGMAKFSRRSQGAGRQRESVGGRRRFHPARPPVSPMLAKLTRELPVGEFLYEPKWDGFRAIVFRDGDDVEIGSRNEKPLTRYFPELVEPLRAHLPEQCVVDGEIVIATERGLDFDLLSLRIHPAASRIEKLAAETPAAFVAFDVLAEGREDLRAAPFSERRARLERMMKKAKPPVLLTPATRDPALAGEWFERFEGAGLDGVVAKPLDGPYREGERTMQKVKHQRTADCAVGRLPRAQGRRRRLAAARAQRRRGVLHHVGVASSFAAPLRQQLAEELAPYRDRALDGHPWRDWAEADAESRESGQRRPGAASRWNAGKDLTWEPLRVELVAEVAYEHLQGDRFRHTARFVRWRPDREPSSAPTRSSTHPSPSSSAKFVRRLSRCWSVRSPIRSLRLAPDHRGRRTCRATLDRSGVPTSGCRRCFRSLRSRPRRSRRRCSRLPNSWPRATALHPRACRSTLVTSRPRSAASGTCA